MISAVKKKQGKWTEIWRDWRERWCDAILYCVVRQDFSDEVTVERGKRGNHVEL